MGTPASRPEGLPAREWGPVIWYTRASIGEPVRWERGPMERDDEWRM